MLYISQDACIFFFLRLFRTILTGESGLSSNRIIWGCRKVRVNHTPPSTCTSPHLELVGSSHCCCCPWLVIAQDNQERGDFDTPPWTPQQPAWDEVVVRRDLGVSYLYSHLISFYLPHLLALPLSSNLKLSGDWIELAGLLPLWCWAPLKCLHLGTVTHFQFATYLPALLS